MPHVLIKCAQVVNNSPCYCIVLSEAHLISVCRLADMSSRPSTLFPLIKTLMYHSAVMIILIHTPLDTQGLTAWVPRSLSTNCQWTADSRSVIQAMYPPAGCVGLDIRGSASLVLSSARSSLPSYHYLQH